MKYEVGQLIIGTVAKVKPFALFMEFDGGVQGLLHISEISDSYIRDIEKYGRVGDRMKVKVVSVDESNGFLRVSLKQVPSEEAFSTHDNNVRSVPQAGENDFKPLASRLHKWIEQTLQEAEKEKEEESL